MIQSDKSDRFTPGGDEMRQDPYLKQLKNKSKYLTKEENCDCCNNIESECTCDDDCQCKCNK